VKAKDLHKRKKGNRAENGLKKKKKKQVGDRKKVWICGTKGKDADSWSTTGVL